MNAITNCLSGIWDHKPYEPDTIEAIKCIVIKRLVIGLLVSIVLAVAGYFLSMYLNSK